MYKSIVRLALVATALASIAACRDNNPLAPEHALKVPPVSKALIGNPIVSITAGDKHTCALRQNGSAYCWGYDQDGELGIGPAPTTCGGWLCADVPTLIPTRTFTWLSAGYSHSCGISGGTAWCWGKNDLFQLGTGDNASSPYPRQTARGVIFNSINSGYNLTCGTSGGTLQCWGAMPHDTSWKVPWQLSVPNFPFDFQNVGVSAGYSGMAHVCAYAFSELSTPTPVLRCFGSNDFGESGVDPAVSGTYLAPYGVPSLTPASSTPAVGTGFTCADVSGGVACFGTNVSGQLGNPLLAGGSSVTPVLVTEATTLPFPIPLPLHGVVAGAAHACAIDVNNNAWCWGENDFMEVGSTALGATFAPVMVGGGHKFFRLAAGTNHTCGLDTDRHVWCWGDDWYGQLGDQQAVRYINRRTELPVRAVGT